MQYITTKYFGPGNVKGSRFKATASGGTSMTVSYNYALTAEKNHRAAAMALAEKLNWHGDWVAGHGDAGNVYVCRPYHGEQDEGFTIAKREA